MVMTITEAIKEWNSSNRWMDCVAASEWFCKRVVGFWKIRIDRYTKEGDLYQHVVVTDGRMIIDLAPYSDKPKDYNVERDGEILHRTFRHGR